MRRVNHKIVAGISTATLLALLSIAPASAYIARRVIIPTPQENPRLNERMMHDPLYERGPYGEPIEPGCHWTRMQIPTSMGLRWVDEEHCESARDSW